jgi:hypothetical protein
MASRWAFEAAMVTQFKDNRFEKEYYIYDKVMADSDFKKIYLIPQLETKLQFCLANYQSPDAGTKDKVNENLELIRNELDRELRNVGRERFTRLDELVPERFNEDVYHATFDFLGKLKKLYINRYNIADKKKEEKIAMMTSNPEKQKEFEIFRHQYHNETVTDLVKNISETNRVLEKDGRLIQKIYPIYKSPDPENIVDFNAQFYMPEKHFLNSNVDTFFFNTGVIWSMTIVLALALYFDVLRRIVNAMGSLTNRFEKT